MKKLWQNIATGNTNDMIEIIYPRDKLARDQIANPQEDSEQNFLKNGGKPSLEREIKQLRQQAKVGRKEGKTRKDMLGGKGQNKSANKSVNKT